MKKLQLTIYTTFLTLLLSTNLIADCSFELFSINSSKGTKIIDFVEQLSDECEFTIIITDPNAEKFLNSKLNKTHLKNLTIDEVFNIILNENNLSYTLENNILKISYLTTKVFAIDYILSQRKSTGTTDITLSSSAAGGSTTTSTSTSSSSGSGSTGAQAESGIKIESTDEVKFWEELESEFRNIINRPHDIYRAEEPIINKNAGLITVTCTIKQMNRFEAYLKRLQKKVQLQVLIDVQLLLVTMTEGQSTGIDWTKLYALQKIDLTGSIVYDKVGAATSTTTKNAAMTLATGVKIDEIIKFLKTQGDVNAISNPKVLTLNNQPALITVGTEYFYKLKTDSLSGAGTTGSLSSSSEDIKSVFSGVLLDITPEISDDRTITLKINPSVSETTINISAQDNSLRTMPPDLNRRQLSSVVTVKDGKRIIIGGLINVNNSINSSQVPLLGNIPILGYLFKYEEKLKTTKELVIIIEPHIIDNENSYISLKDLGYKGMTDDLLNKTEAVSKKLLNADVK